MPLPSVYDRPAAEVLREHGVELRQAANRRGWLSFTVCPACGSRNLQCGIKEEPGTARARVVSFKCFNTGKSALGPDPTYTDLLRHLGALPAVSPGAARRAAPHAAPRSASPAGPSATGEAARPLAGEWHARLEHRFWSTPAALAYWRGRGLDDEAFRHFRLGLTRPKDGTHSHDATAYPLIGADGVPLNRFGYYAVPGLTAGARDTAWFPGPVSTYWALPRGGADGRPRRAVLVVEGMKDAWAVWRQVHATPLGERLAVITSTHGTSVPPEWDAAAFWEGFDAVYVGTDADAAGDAFAAKIAACAGAARPGMTVRRARVPAGLARSTKPNAVGKDWTDYFLSGHGVEDFARLLDAGDAMGETLTPVAEGARTPQLGRMAYRPVDITASFINGALYYPIDTLVRREDRYRDPETGEESVSVAEAIETVVIRSSDRTLHRAEQMPAPRGVPEGRRVWRLKPDGTMILQPPRQNRYATWSWESIEAWQRGQAKPRAVAALLADLEAHFRRSVWLPYEEDYTLLALTTIVTYVQAVFDAVPLILVNGPAGTGKTTVGRAVAAVAYNASIVGAVSAAAVARHIDETRGFVALDDLESIGAKGRAQDAAFGELVQALKLSYNKETATKTWVDAKTMRVETLQFFGVKVISNTAGVDNILGSRMFRIQTRKIPDALRGHVQITRAADVRALQRLRDELHCWAFDHVRQVDATYRVLCPLRTDRQDEIAAPLRTIAALAGDRAVDARLAAVIDRQRNGTLDPDDPIETLKEAVEGLVREGYRELSPTHVGLEVSRLMGPTAGRETTTDIPEWQRPDWVGRQLRQLEIIDYAAQGARPRLEWGYQLRVYPIRPAYVLEILGIDVDPLASGSDAHRDSAEGPARKPPSPTAWCRGCDACPYRPACDFAPRRLEWERRRTPHLGVRAVTPTNGTGAK